MKVKNNVDNVKVHISDNVKVHISDNVKVQISDNVKVKILKKYFLVMPKFF